MHIQVKQLATTVIIAGRSLLTNEKRRKFDQIFGSFVCLFMYHPETPFCGWDLSFE